MASNRGVVRLLALAGLGLTLGGCQVLGAGGSLIGSLASVAFYLIAIAAPFVLGYYIYRWTK